MNNTPTISVILPAYNSEKYIREAVLSILSQSYTDFELLIIDDASTDQTMAKVKDFDDPRIIIIKNDTNLGLPATLNKAIGLAKGKYIARMDADDISLPNRFKKQVEFLEKNPDISIVGTFAKSFGNGKSVKMTHPTSPEEIKVNLLFKTSVMHPTIMLRSDFLIKYNLEYNPKFLQTQDYEFFVRASGFGKIANIPEVLLMYRKHDKQATSEKSANQMEYAKKIMDGQFKKLGMEVAPSDLDTAVSLKKYTFINDKNFPASLQNLFLKIVTANQNSKIYDEKTLKKVLGDLWVEMATAYRLHNIDAWNAFNDSPIKKWVSPSLRNIYRTFRLYTQHARSFGK